MVKARTLLLGTTIGSLGYFYWMGAFKTMHITQDHFAQSEAFFKPYQGPFNPKLAKEYHKIEEDVKIFKEKEPKVDCKYQF